MSPRPPRPPLATPDCCALGARNLEWFPASGRRGAWHASSFRWNPRRDAPTTAALTVCPFCGEALSRPRKKLRPRKTGR